MINAELTRNRTGEFIRHVNRIANKNSATLAIEIACTRLT